MKALSSFSVFRVPPLPAGALEPFREALAVRRFRPPNAGQERSRGWTSPIAADGDADPLLLQEPWAILGARLDEKAIPPALAKMRLDERARRWCREHLRDSCPRSVRAEFAETVKLELLATMPATPHTGLVLAELDTGRLFVGAASGKVHEAAVGLWHDTFGQKPAPVSVVDELAAEFDARTWEHLAEDDPREGHVALRREQLGRFFAWLWWRGESSSSDLPSLVRAQSGQKLSWLAGGGISLADQGSERRRLTVRAENAAADPAVRVALVEGHQVDGLELGLRLEDLHAYDVGLAAKEGEIVIRSVTLPRGSRDDLEHLVETALHVEDIHRCLCDLFRVWAKTAGHPDHQGQALATFRAWLESDLLQWAGRQTSWGRKLLDVAEGAG